MHRDMRKEREGPTERAAASPCGKEGSCALMKTFSQTERPFPKLFPAREAKLERSECVKVEAAVSFSLLLGRRRGRSDSHSQSCSHTFRREKERFRLDRSDRFLWEWPPTRWAVVARLKERGREGKAHAATQTPFEQLSTIKNRMECPLPATVVEGRMPEQDFRAVATY